MGISPLTFREWKIDQLYCIGSSASARSLVKTKHRKYAAKLKEKCGFCTVRIAVYIEVSIKSHDLFMRSTTLWIVNSVVNWELQFKFAWSF